MSDGLKVEEWLKQEELQDELDGRTETLKPVAMHPAQMLTRASAPVLGVASGSTASVFVSGCVVRRTGRGRLFGEKTWYAARADDKGRLGVVRVKSVVILCRKEAPGRVHLGTRSLKLRRRRSTCCSLGVWVFRLLAPCP